MEFTNNKFHKNPPQWLRIKIMQVRQHLIALENILIRNEFNSYPSYTSITWVGAVYAYKPLSV